MENLAYIGLSQQVALKQQLEVTAGNLANMNTSGYKTQNILFADYIAEPKRGEQINQAYNFKTYRDLAQGSMNQTFNPFDVAISGEGYFSIQTPGGTAYTRDGGFMLNANRELVTKSGNIVMGDGGGAIQIPQDAGQISITPDGSISTNEGIIGKIRVTSFDDEQKLTRLGDNLYDAGGATEQPPAEIRVTQGMVEGSNVNPVVEMTRMTEILRSFQSAQNMQQNDHDRQRKMIQSLTRTA